MANTGSGSKAKKSGAEKTIDEAAKAGRAAVENVVNASAENVTKTFEKAANVTRNQVDKAISSLGDVSEFARENVDAAVTVGSVAAKSAEALNSELLSISKRSMEEATSAAKAFSGVKTAKEFFELQSDLMKSSWERFVEDSNAVGEIFSEGAKQAAAPINSRVAATVEQISKPLSL